MNKDDLLKDFMSDISHKILMQKYNLTKKEFDQFRIENNLDKDDRYILKDKAILEDFFAGYPDTFVMQKHSITIHKLKRCLKRAGTGIGSINDYKINRIKNLYLDGISIDDICDEYDYEYSVVESLIKEALRDDFKLIRNRNIVEDYIAGTETEALISKYGINAKTINKILRDSNIKIRL
ncbi:TPA: hypothetical protein ACJXXT_000198 [Pseudomonas aeruginosa]